MQYRLLDNLGTLDAATLNKNFGLRLDMAKIKMGDIIELSDEAAAFLKKKYDALFEPAGGVKAVPQAAAIAKGKE